MGWWTCLPVFAGFLCLLFLKVCICCRFWCFCWGYSQIRHQCPQSKSSACFESKTPATFPIKAERISWGWTTGCKSTGTDTGTDTYNHARWLLNARWVLSVFAAVSVLHASFRLCQSIVVLCCIKWKNLLWFITYMWTPAWLFGTVNLKLARN